MISNHWEKVGRSPHHGICVPLFSLRTKKSSGIGEFLDLIPLIDWCKTIGMDLIQLLPINDTGGDPSPYNPISSCALDPIYLSLADLGLGSDFQSLQRHEVLAKKLALLHTYFLHQTLPPEYENFVAENPWLEPYAYFKAHKESPNPTRSQVDFYIFLQFLCFSQMEKVYTHATIQGIFLKGDIPILISPDSADVWAEPNLFRLDLAAGAPPDYYNSKGQYWGFPLFNWDAMRHNGFTWWKRRLKVAEKLFHIYRIDHVIGFFRIWAIPLGQKPTQGSFIPPDRSLWEPLGRELLQMFLESTSMLAIAEDLGVVPKEVGPVLKEFGICSTKVLRWQRHWDTDKSYIPYNQYEPLSMTTISTPDMETLELWWRRYPDEAIPFAQFKGWNYHPILTQKQRLEILQDAHSTSSIFHINLLQEYLALFPELVWPNPEQERINLPGTVNETNWTYRFRPYLEEMVAHKELTLAIQKILSPF